MRKIISLILFLFSVGIFLGYSFYTKGSFDYNIAQFLGYLFYWSVALFIFSLFSLILENKKYKIWSLFTLIYVLISISIAYKTGDGSSAIVSFDGKLLTWFFICIYSLTSIIYFMFQFFKKNKSN